MKNITEQKAIKLFTDKFGTDMYTRFLKFEEEFNELKELINLSILHGSYIVDMIPEKTLLHIRDELSDCQGTLSHLASIFELYQSEMLDSCIDKVIQRETNPDYKRFK